MTTKATKNISYPNCFKFDVMIASPDGMSVQKIGEHINYHLDGQRKMSEWVRGVLPKCFKSVNTTDGIKCRTDRDGCARGTICDGSLGYAVMSSNCVEANAQFVGLFSVPFSRGNGFNLLPENFDRAVSGFAARRLVSNDVWNDKDSYMVPDVNSPLYEIFQKDAYVFALFEHQSYQTSIKGDVGGEAYEFVNQFYPFTKEETFDFLGWDKKVNFKNEVRYIRSSGKLDNLTTEGQAVLDAFKKCMVASASARMQYDKDHKELQVLRWDCGWRQLKKLFEEACPAEFAELKAKFKALKEKMLPMVYELGFLKK